MSLLSRHRVARLGLVSALALVLGLAATGRTEAGVVTYTLTGGTIDGTLNGVVFTGANFTITAQADPTAFVSEQFLGLPLYTQVVTSTMTIDGFGAVDLTDANFGLLAVNLDSVVPGFYYGGFGYQVAATSLSGFVALGPLLNGNNIQGSFEVSVGTSYGTTGGVLYISNFSDNGAVFNDTVPVPEPGTLVMGGLLAVGGGVVSFRKLRRKAA